MIVPVGKHVFVSVQTAGMYEAILLVHKLCGPVMRILME